MRIRKKPVVVATEGRWFQSGDIPDVSDYRVKSSMGDPEFCATCLSYRVKPVVRGPEFCATCLSPWSLHGWIKTLEGGHIVCPGDWIIVGIKGEKYPCKPDIFEMTYDRNWLVNDPPTLFALCKDILDFADHGDYSNGNDGGGLDEGRVRAGEALDLYRKKLEEFEKENPQ